MSDIRFNNWLHQSGTGGVSQDSSGNVGIGSTLPTCALDIGNVIKIDSGIVTATSFSGNLIGNEVTIGSGVTNYAGILSARELYGDGSKLTGIDNSVLKDNTTNSTRVASNPAGIEITGIATATSFVGDGANITGIPTTGDINALEQSIAMLGFYRATDNSKAKYTLVDQIIDEYVDASGIDASASTNEATTAGYYYGVSGGNATGGTETTHGSYKVHSFTTAGNSNFVVPSSGNVDYLVVAGGGGGGSWGGGGAGGYRSGTSFAVTAQTYTITVGDGGSGASNGQSNNGGNGGNSVFSTITSTGGGGGGGGNGQNGGSGGGSGAHNCGNGPNYSCNNSGAGNTPSTSPSQGNAGGNAYQGGGGCGGYQGGGGGGGSGNAGGNGGTSKGGVGGSGTNNNFRTGSNVEYAGGGGGAGYSDGCNPGDSAGGNTRPMPNAGGGGGSGGSPSPYTPNATNATANTGGGGGADPDGATAGGSGIVVIRYLNNSTFSGPGGNMTLQSNATTADSAPTVADIIMLIENAYGTATLNTDIKAFVSRNGNFNTLNTDHKEVVLKDEGTWGTNKKILAAHDVDISGITAGTAMKYRIQTLNQSTSSKETRIHATSLAWK